MSTQPESSDAHQSSNRKPVSNWPSQQFTWTLTGVFTMTHVVAIIFPSSRGTVMLSMISHLGGG